MRGVGIRVSRQGGGLLRQRLSLRAALMGLFREGQALPRERQTLVNIMSYFKRGPTWGGGFWGIEGAQQRVDQQLRGNRDPEGGRGFSGGICPECGRGHGPIDLSPGQTPAGLQGDAGWRSPPWGRVWKPGGGNEQDQGCPVLKRGRQGTISPCPHL